MTSVILIEPVSSGRSLIRRGRELGFDVIVLTHNSGDRRIPCEQLDLAHQVEVVDTNDDDRTLGRAQRLHAESPVSAVLPGFEYYVPLAARISAALGVPGLDPTAALALRYKHYMRQALRDQGIPIPAYAVVEREHEVAGALELVGLPCVVKPVDQSGSLHVRKATTLPEAQAAFQAIRFQAFGDLDRLMHPCVLIEQYVAGPEYSVEGFVENGTTYILNVTTKLLNSEPYFVELGHIVPGDLSHAAHQDVAEYVTRVTKALRLTLGPFHAEVRISSQGPILMEIGARLAGDRIPDLLLLARGIDLYHIMYRNYLGLSSTALIQPQRQSWAGIRFFIRPGVRRYAHFSGRDDLESDSRIQEIALLVPPGSEVPEPTSFLGRLGYVIATGPSYAATASALENADQKAAFTTHRQLTS